MPVTAKLSLVADSVTDLGPDAVDRAVACGSHGGQYSCGLAAHRGVRGIVLNDAGRGLEDAGIAGLASLDSLGLPAGAVSHAEAHIGIGTDTWSGLVRHLNESALALGCRVGDPVRAVLERIAAAPAVVREHPTAAPTEVRLQIGGHPVPVWVVDSASQVRAEDAGTFIVTGSHGGAPGGSAQRALKADALGAVFNDAGGGPDGAGWSRLPLLDQRGIAAVTVAETSARIGDGFSSFASGRVRRANDAAVRLGVRAGMTVPDVVAAVAAGVDPSDHQTQRARR